MMFQFAKAGDKDCCGFAVTGKEEVSFDEQVPRGRWVHVAFAAARWALSAIISLELHYRVSLLSGFVAQQEDVPLL